jgi:1-aminocyclopropane-1-carboxylate deaminase/D-cysteine desulfhydrase-like pyridoxal-dependent ACC family enzyme
MMATRSSGHPSRAVLRPLQKGDPAKILSPDALSLRLSRLPRTSLAMVPTPLHELPTLSRDLGVRVLVKRDDLTGLAFGGNKVRQLEFFLGDAATHGADVVVAGGSFAQSNHARVCAAAARAAGLGSVILVRPGGGSAGVQGTGNALLTRVFADEVRLVPELDAIPREDRLVELRERSELFARVAEELRDAGRTPYVLLGSSVPLGVLGYVDAAIELHHQRRMLGLDFSKLFVTSLGATQAGLELGRYLLGDPYQVIGMSYQPATRPATAILNLLDGAAEMLDADVRIAESDLINDDALAGPEYGVLNDQAREALFLAARSDGLLLDPVYSAKGFAGMLSWIREGRVKQGETIVFLHTGGLPALFAYADELEGTSEAGIRSDRSSGPADWPPVR